MRCEEIRAMVEETGVQECSPSAREHLRHCPACEAYARDWELIRAGLQELRSEPVPEPSLGFAARLIRRLEKPARESAAWEEFLEKVGRRFVYACLLLALTLLLVLALPPTGPLRVSASAEIFTPRSELAAARSDPIVGDDAQVNHDLVPPEFVVDVGREKK